MSQNQFSLFSVVEPISKTETPNQYQRIFEVLDAYNSGEVSYREVLALDENELRAARAWKQAKIEAHMAEEFPELDGLDGL